MRASRIVAAVIAIGAVGFGFQHLANGLSMPMPENPVCKDVRLSFPDQNACSQQLTAAQTPAAKDQVVARYQAKISAATRPHQHTTAKG